PAAPYSPCIGCSRPCCKAACTSSVRATKVSAAAGPGVELAWGSAARTAPAQKSANRPSIAISASLHEVGRGTPHPRSTLFVAQAENQKWGLVETGSAESERSPPWSDEQARKAWFGSAFPMPPSFLTGYLAMSRAQGRGKPRKMQVEVAVSQCRAEAWKGPW